MPVYVLPPELSALWRKPMTAPPFSGVTRTLTYRSLGRAARCSMQPSVVVEVAFNSTPPVVGHVAVVLLSTVQVGYSALPLWQVGATSAKTIGPTPPGAGGGDVTDVP